MREKNGETAGTQDRLGLFFLLCAFFSLLALSAHGALAVDTLDAACKDVCSAARVLSDAAAARRALACALALAAAKAKRGASGALPTDALDALLDAPSANAANMKHLFPKSFSSRHAFGKLADRVSPFSLVSKIQYIVMEIQDIFLKARGCGGAAAGARGGPAPRGPAIGRIEFRESGVETSFEASVDLESSIELHGLCGSAETRSGVPIGDWKRDTRVWQARRARRLRARLRRCCRCSRRSWRRAARAARTTRTLSAARSSHDHPESHILSLKKEEKEKKKIPTRLTSHVSHRRAWRTRVQESHDSHQTHPLEHECVGPGARGGDGARVWLRRAELCRGLGVRVLALHRVLARGQAARRGARAVLRLNTQY